MSETVVLAGLFVFVMAAIVAAGYIFMPPDEPVLEPESSVLAEPELPRGRAFFAQAFRRVGENVPAAKETRDALVAFLTKELGTESVGRAKTYMEDPLRMTVHLLMSTPEYQVV